MSVIGNAAGIKHGTLGGYKQHLFRKVEVCDDCREANRAARAAARDKARQHQALVKAAAKERSVRDMYIRPYSPHPPGWQNPAWGIPVAGRDLKIGDQLVHIHASLGTHTIDRFKPYDGSLPLGSDARTACSGTWEIAVAATATVRILPREGR
ncbi:hypothetical protein ACU635_51030 [[Actinomadura] parvosata]|uniref:hypothetical protein n=1 Tax=[Actinomadura] parvosata TaxID=1955412 RepID=UPI00406BF108